MEIEQLDQHRFYEKIEKNEPCFFLPFSAEEGVVGYAAFKHASLTIYESHPKMIYEVLKTLGKEQVAADLAEKFGLL